MNQFTNSPSTRGNRAPLAWPRWDAGWHAQGVWFWRR
jgi:hypothetical protein